MRTRWIGRGRGAGGFWTANVSDMEGTYTERGPRGKARPHGKERHETGE